jgi:predicted nuclease with TOPRIM domain
VVMQGSIAELAAAGKQSILIATSDDERALRIVADHRAVNSASPGTDGIRVAFDADVDAEAVADDIGRRIVLAGLALRRFEPARFSLERRFLEITSRLEEAA